MFKKLGIREYIALLAILTIGATIVFAQNTGSTQMFSPDIPSGYDILGTNKTAPIGYTYTGDYLTSIEIWNKKASLPTGRALFGAAVINSKIYAIGGTDGTNQFLKKNEIYNPATDKWSAKADMPTGRYAMGVVSVNGKIYAIGGAGVGDKYLKTNEEYDPGNNTWTTKADMPTARIYASVVTINGKIYVIGGWNGSDLKTNEEYDPVTNTWSSKADMPTARHGTGAGALKGKIYVIGGVPVGGPGWGTALKTNEEYNPVNNTWTNKKDIPIGVVLPGSAVANGRLYIMGGASSEGNYINKNQEYNPIDDLWVARKDMPTNRYSLASATVTGRIYAIGGSNGTILSTNEEYKPSLVYYIHIKN